jgi:hypothetical protein
MVSAADVRRVINQVEVSDLLPDTVVNAAISDAIVELEVYVSKTVPTQLIEKATKYKAALLSFTGYAARLERGIDQITPQTKVLIDTLQKEFDTCMNQIKMYFGAPAPTEHIQRTDSLWDKDEY